MADSTGEERRNGGGSGEPKGPTTQAPTPYAHARAYVHAMVYTHARLYVLLAMKGSGLLAVLISTVILLGGYVQSLGKIDFWSIIVISVIQTAGIVTDRENTTIYTGHFLHITERAVDATEEKHHFLRFLLALTGRALSLCAVLIWFVGPFACAAISVWRMWELSHSNWDSMANMRAALNIFYSLVLFQGILFGVHIVLLSWVHRCVVSKLLAPEQLQAKWWGKRVIYNYLVDIYAKCREDPRSVKGMDLIKYAVELLDSESQRKYRRGARLLSTFVKKGALEDVRSLLLPSRQKIQKLIESLRLSSSLDDDDKEIREHAATILADLASDIDLDKYLDLMPSISSLLLQEETTQTYWNSKQVCQHFEDEGKETSMTIAEKNCYVKLMKDQDRPKKPRKKRHREGGASYKLILRGLAILEGLASNNDNCRLICSAPGLIPKITAPIYSETLIEDVITIKEWAAIVTRSLKLLYKLIRAPGGTSSSLHHEISSNGQALGNLKSILDLDNQIKSIPDLDNLKSILDLSFLGDEAIQELKLAAMGILTELALDLSVSLALETKKFLITKQLHVFLANGEGEESAAMAGRALVSLSTNREISAFIISTQEDIIGGLTEILGAKDNITHRTIAAEIMENLCNHCDVDKQHMKEILQKVLNEISIKSDPQQMIISADQNNAASADEENQKYSASGNDGEMQKISSTADRNKSSDQGSEEQEAFLALILTISHKLNNADDFDDAIRSTIERREAFVDNLKSIVNDNCKAKPARPANLRIVNLCAQIAESMMQCQRYADLFRNKRFNSALIKASKTMSRLESRMLFHGTDFGRKKTVRPLIYYIRKM